MNRFKLEIKNVDTGEFDTVSVELTDEHKSILEEYLENVQKLVKTNVIRNGLNTNITVSLNRETGGSFKSQIPSEDDIAILLHKMRRFVLKKEQASFEKTIGIIKRSVVNTHIRQLIDNERKTFEGSYIRSLIQISFNNEIINSESKLTAWLNAFEYHNDREKRQEIQLLFNSLTENNAKAIFLALLTEKVKAIINVSSIINLLLGNTTRLEASV